MYIVNVPTNQPFVTYAQDCHVMFHLMQHDQHPCLPLRTAGLIQEGRAGGHQRLWTERETGLLRLGSTREFRGNPSILGEGFTLVAER